MKIAIVGSRGIPAGYGGFETFAEEISIRLNKEGVDVAVVCQNADERNIEYKKIKLLYSQFTKFGNPVLFYRDSIRIGLKCTDIIIVCGVGGALFFPFYKSKNKFIITHVDGREELRGKYSALKKLFVRVCQSFTAKFADHIIADSFAVSRYWKEKFNIPDERISSIEFGANTFNSSDKPEFPVPGLVPGEYYLVVCRMVPENNPELIIKGFLKSGCRKKLVLVGDSTDEYGKSLRKYSSPLIIFSEGIYDKAALFTLRENSFAYIHGHSVGGTNPSLLEAMAAGNICICHDNEFNRETTESKMLYFSGIEDLASRIDDIEKMTVTDRHGYPEVGIKRIKEYYNWERITGEYMKLLQSIRIKQ